MYEVVELVTDYLEGAASRTRYDAAWRITSSLCDGCTRYLDQMRETIRLTGMLTEEQIPEEQKTALLDAFRTGPADRSRELTSPSAASQRK